MSQPQSGNTVRVHYTGRLDDGSVFDSSKERDPLEFVVGSGMVIPGFDSAVLGLSVGESVTVTIPAADAYGEKREDMVAVVDRAQFPESIVPEVGVQLQIPEPSGRVLIVTITNIEGNEITLDANHHLAGKNLTFDIELLEVK